MTVPSSSLLIALLPSSVFLSVCLSVTSHADGVVAVLVEQVKRRTKLCTHTTLSEVEMTGNGFLHSHFVSFPCI